MEELNEVGISLSRVKDTNRLLEAILVAAKRITNADGGTLYRVDADKKLFTSRLCGLTHWTSRWEELPGLRCHSIRCDCSTMMDNQIIPWSSPIPYCVMRP